MMLYEAIKYWNCGLSPIPLYSPKMINRGESPDWYEEKRKEILDMSKEPPKRNEEVEDEDEVYPNGGVQTEELLTELNIETCKTALPIVDIEKYQTHRPTEKEVRRWFIENPEANIGLLIGKNYNLVIVDIDKKVASAYQKGPGRKADAPIVETNNGFHYYFTYTTFQDLEEKKLNPEITIWRKPYVVAPPSIDGRGFVYKWRRHITNNWSCCDNFFLGSFVCGLTEVKCEQEKENFFGKCINY